jgi:hypothetical protein
MKEFIDKIQALIDLHGDTWLGIFTALIMLRIAAAVFKFPPITMSEAGAYASCVTAFAATNIGGPKS